MADATTTRDDKRQEGQMISVLVDAVNIVKGTLLNFNASGYAKKASDTSGEVFAGVAIDPVDNSAGSAGGADTRVWREGIFSMAASGATQAWVGQKVYVVDNQTVALAATTTNDVLVGTVVQVVSATEVKVKI